MFGRRWSLKTSAYAAITTVLTILIFLATVGASSLTLSKKCGDQLCEKYQLCAQQELVCYPCSKVCESNSHNYNQKSCEENCQDYIHDHMLEYVRKCDLEHKINQLYTLSLVSLVLILILVTIVAGVIFVIFYRHRKGIQARNLEKKKYQQKLNAVQYSISNNNDSQQSDGTIKTISHAMRDAMPSTITLTTQTESPPPTNKSTNTVSTLPLSKQEPCEDTTLDYAAYVNQALSHSPTNDKI